MTDTVAPSDIADYSVPTLRELRVIGLRYSTYEWERRKPIRNGSYTYPVASVGVLEIATDGGVTGIGLATDPLTPGGGAVVAEAIRLFAPLIIDQDPIHHERLWAQMWRPKLVGRRGLTTRAISTIDIAVWDLRAKVVGLPLYRLLGGYRDSIPAYIAGGYYEDGKGTQGLIDEVMGYVDLGARAIKIKIGGLEINEDIKRVRAVREAIGPDVKLMVDANGAYEVFEAIDIGRKMAEYGIYWFEEPITPDNYEGMKKVGQHIPIPIAAGENEYTKYGIRDLIEQGEIGILNLDAQILGGVTEYIKAAALAETHGIPVAPHGSQEVHIHLVTGLPNSILLEYYSTEISRSSSVMDDNIELSDGHIRPPECHGIGRLARDNLTPTTEFIVGEISG